MAPRLVSNIRNAHGITAFVILAAIACVGVPLCGQQFVPVQQMYFSKAAGATDPLPQIITVTSGESNIEFTASAVTSSGGHWLDVTPLQDCCMTPAQVSVKVNTSASLTAGTYSGEIRLTGNDANYVVPVTLIVTPSHRVRFDRTPSQLMFTMKAHGEPPAQVMRISHIGDGNLSWRVIATTFNGASFLKVSEDSGTGPVRLSD